MDETIIRIHKSEIAKQQLMTAIGLFLRRIDFASVITLAGASGNILHQLVLNEGKRPFVDLGRDFANYTQGQLLSRSTYKNRLERLFGVLQLKHMSDICDEILELDLETSAINSLTYVVHDYIALYGKEEEFIKAFLSWVWVNRNALK